MTALLIVNQYQLLVQQVWAPLDDGSGQPPESDASRRETYTRSRFRYPLFGFPTAFDDLYTVLSFILCDSSTVARDAKGDCDRRSVADDATFDDSAFLDLPATRRAGGCSRARKKGARW